MNKEILNRSHKDIKNFRYKFGEVLYDSILEHATVYRMAREVIDVFSKYCDTEKEFVIADAMLMAICNCNFENLTQKIKKADEVGYEWENY